MPLDIQLSVLAYVPLADLARLATLSKGMRAVYTERLQERETCIDARVDKAPDDVIQRLAAVDIAVPRDLVVTPPVSLLFVILCAYH
jgi:hypothetical protein